MGSHTISLVVCRHITLRHSSLYESNKKIDALFDGRIDEIRHRKENIETNAKVADLEMRVDNLEKIVKAS